MRYRELDSLRGLAALFVVLSHCMLLLPIYGNIAGGNVESGLISDIWRDSPLHLFWSGHQSVILFFILSGFVLSLPFYSKKQLPYQKYLIRRVFRIYFPYIVSLVVTITLVKAFTGAGDVANYSDWFYNLWNQPLELKLVLSHIFFIGDYDVYAYNPVYWSLVQEMRISFIFPILMWIITKYNGKISLVLSGILSFLSLFIVSKTGANMASISFLPHYIGMFIVGAVLAKNKQLLIDLFKKLSIKMKICVGIIGVLFYTYEFIFPKVFVIHKYIMNEWATVLGASIIIVVSMGSEKLKSILLKKPITFLGDISYSLYLYHFPIMISLVYLLGGKLPYLIIVFLTVALSVVVANFSYKYVEKPFVNIGKKLTLIKSQSIEYKKAL